MQPMEMRPPWTRSRGERMLTAYPRKNRTLTTLLSWQHTVVEEHSLPVPTPMTVIGEQLRPRSASTPSRTTPSSPRRAVPAGEEACRKSRRQSIFDAWNGDGRRTSSVDWQHCTGPVEHDVAVWVVAGAVAVTVIVVVVVAVVVGVFHGVAAARVASVAKETRAGARNIILLVSAAAVTGEGAAGCWLLWSLGELTAACAGFIRATGPPRPAASRTF